MKGCFTAIALLLFGCWSVRSPPLKPDESVLIFPTVGWQKTNGWEIEVHGLVFEPHAHKLLTRVLRRSLGIDEEALQPGEDKLFAERARYFLVDNERHKQLTIRFGARTETLSPAPANGHFHAQFFLPSDSLGVFGISRAISNGLLEVETVSQNAKVHPFHGDILLVPSNGLSVISDIDDTIKISKVRDRHELVRNTFLRPFQGVPGMADVYRNWSTNSGATFHYVSASPWQLYAPLSDFLQANGFPRGTFHMKQFRVRDRSLLTFSNRPNNTSQGLLVICWGNFPIVASSWSATRARRIPRFMAALLGNTPDQIWRIFIRDVSNEPESSERYKNAFAGIASFKWHVFQKSSEIINGIP